MVEPSIWDADCARSSRVTRTITEVDEKLWEYIMIGLKRKLFHALTAKNRSKKKWLFITEKIAINMTG